MRAEPSRVSNVPLNLLINGIMVLKWRFQDSTRVTNRSGRFPVGLDARALQ